MLTISAMLFTEKYFFLGFIRKKINGLKYPTIIWEDSGFLVTCEGQCGSGPNVAGLPESRVLSSIATPRQAFKLLEDFSGILVDEHGVAAIQVSFPSSYFDQNFEFGFSTCTSCHL